MTDTLHNSAGSHVSNTLTISVLEDLRGDGCTYTTDRTVINNVLSDFSGDASVKMEISEDPTCEGFILTLTDNGAHPVSTLRIHSNRIGCTERDEETGLLWYGRGYI
jgi:hypothetical protein